MQEVHRFGVENCDRWLEAYETARSAAARLSNAEAGEIAFAKNTSEAISFVANGLDWRAGDEVVSAESEFPANCYPWKVQEKKGVRLVLVQEERGESISGVWSAPCSHPSGGHKLRSASRQFCNAEREFDRVLELLGSYEPLEVSQTAGR